MTEEDPNHYFNLTVDNELWTSFVRTIPREKSIQKRLNEMIKDEVNR